MVDTSLPTSTSPAQPPSSSSPPDPFRLLNLALELRDHIYHYANLDAAMILDNGFLTYSLRAVPKIAQTCRQVRQEALTNYYKNPTRKSIVNTTRWSLAPLESTLKHIGPRFTQTIRCIHIMMLGGLGFGDATVFMRLKEQYLQADCKLEMVALQASSQVAWWNALSIAQSLRAEGISWEKLDKTMKCIREIMDSVGSVEYEWPLRQWESESYDDDRLAEAPDGWDFDSISDWDEYMDKDSVRELFVMHKRYFPS